MLKFDIKVKKSSKSNNCYYVLECVNDIGNEVDEVFTKALDFNDLRCLKLTHLVDFGITDNNASIIKKGVK